MKNFFFSLFLFFSLPALADTHIIIANFNIGHASRTQSTIVNPCRTKQAIDSFMLIAYDADIKVVSVDILTTANVIEHFNFNQVLGKGTWTNWVPLAPSAPKCIRRVTVTANTQMGNGRLQVGANLKNLP